MATVNRKSISGSKRYDGNLTQTENWQVITDLTEPYEVIDVDGLPPLKSQLSGTSMRVTSIDPTLEKIAADGSYVWDVAVKYETVRNTDAEEPVNGTEIWTISGQMQQETVKQALEQTAMSGSVEVGLLVGVKDDGTVEGAPWGVPVLSLSVTLYKSASSMSASYIAGCLAAVGKVNNRTWYGFAPGEIRLENVSIPKKLEDLWALQFDFAIKLNESKAELPSYPGAGSTMFEYSRDVLGWEYAWTRETETVDSTTKEKEAKTEGLYIAKFFRTSAFADLGLSGRLF